MSARFLAGIRVGLQSLVDPLPPYLAKILDAAVCVGPRLVGIIYPRDVWWMVAFMRISNAVQALRRDVAHYFICRHNEVGRLLGRNSYKQVYDGGTRGWRVAVYLRA